MGWSATREACKTEERISRLCREQTGSQNTWRTGRGEFFYELPDEEYADGRIRGKVMFMTSAGHCRYGGVYRINPDGTIARWDHLPKEWR